MAHPCNKPCGSKTASGYCATTACINPQYSNIGTVYYGQGVQKRIITNADRIRSMTDEELAEFIAQQRYCTINPIADKLGIDTTQMFIKCQEILLDWLRKEASE